jgi:hypothetical protein
VDFSFKAAIDPDSAFHSDFPLEVHALRQECNVVIAAKTILFHAVPPTYFSSSPYTKWTETT